MPDAEISFSMPIEEKSKRAFEVLNKLKQIAREMMSDKKTRVPLDEEYPNLSFEELIQSKMKRKNMTREEAIIDVYNTATTTNERVNKELRVGGE